MADIIKFKDAVKRIANSEIQTDLTGLLKKAVVLKKNIPELTTGIRVTNFKKLKSLFEAKISDILIRKQLIGSDFFLCGTYIANLLTETTKKIPKHLFVIDYIIESNKNSCPQTIKQGANLCFLLSTIFKDRCEIKTMTYKDYEKLGMGLFHQFSNQTGTKIGYCMSRQYKIMAGVTDECMKSI